MSRRGEQKQAARGVRAQLAKERRRSRALWISFGLVVVLAIAGFVGWRVYRAQRPPDYAMPSGVVSDGGANAGIVAADEGGAIPVEVYLDFSCQTCRQFQATTTATLNQLLADKKITLVWHPVSLLDAQSNPPGYSTRAALATACAADVSRNKMKAFGEALFTIQPVAGGPGYNDDQLIDIAGTVGIITPVFAACLRDATYTDWIRNVDTTAAQRGVDQTGATQPPAVYVNGKVVDQPGPATITAAVASGG